MGGCLTLGVIQTLHRWDSTRPGLHPAFLTFSRTHDAVAKGESHFSTSLLPHQGKRDMVSI